MRRSRMSYDELLRKYGYTMDDVDKAFRETEKKLKKKKYAKEKHPLEDKSRQRRVGLFVTLRQSDNPLKMFIMQELYVGKKEPELRIGYYIISKKMSRDKGKLSVQWGQFNPNFPKKDLKELLRRAEQKGIL